MTFKKIVISIFIVIGVMFLFFTPALALPPLPSSFWGTVKINGANVAAGTVVSAWINGVKYADTVVQDYLGDTVYSLDVPGDDPATPSVIEGGVEGSIVVFHIGSLVTTVNGTWHAGTNVELNINVSPTSVTLVDLQAKNGNSLVLSSLLSLGLIGILGLAVVWYKNRL